MAMWLDYPPATLEVRGSNLMKVKFCFLILDKFFLVDD